MIKIDFKTEYEQQKEYILQLEAEIKLLREQVLLARHKQFAPKSEQINTNQLTLSEEGDVFNEIEAESNSLLPEPELEEIIYKRKKQKGKREQDLSAFPVERVIIELPENEQICTPCGSALIPVGEIVVRRELTVTPPVYKVTEYVQVTYGCENKCDKSEPIKSSVPAPLIPNSGIASPSLVAQIANNKFTQALPIHRQESELKRNGINLSRQTMANWLMYVYEHYLQHFMAFLMAYIIAQEVLHADETTTQVLLEPERKAQTKSYMFVVRTAGSCANQAALFEYSPTRSAVTPKRIFADYNGYLHTDGYQVYRGIEGVIVVGCFAHVRRYYFEALKSLSQENQKSSYANKGLQYCDAMFKIERDFREKELSFDERKIQRDLYLKPLAEEFFTWAETQLAKCSEVKSALQKALFYTVNQKSYLMNVFLDGRLELSNNLVENAIRPFAVGRKNWLFCTSEKGAKASAAFYSIIETAKANNLKPYEYLKFLFEQMPNTPIEQYDSLLPWSQNVPDSCKSKVPIEK